MGFYKINYGNVDDKYGIFFYKQDANNQNFFITQVNNAIQENIKSLIKNENLNTIATFNWVESCEAELDNIGYKSVNLVSYYFDFSIDEENNIEIFTDSLNITNNNLNKNGITLYEIGIFSEFHIDITFNSYFLSNHMTNNEFDIIIKDFIEQNVDKKNNKIEAYSELLASYMVEKGFEIITPEDYFIYCDHSHKLPHQWIDVLGKELYDEICNRNEPPQNVERNFNNNLELPF
jgi:hypothetical protein